MAIPFSILDLVPIVEGGTAAGALQNTLDFARHAERYGYHRYWLAEHHNMPGVASAATAVDGNRSVQHDGQNRACSVARQLRFLLQRSGLNRGWKTVSPWKVLLFVPYCFIFSLNSERKAFACVW